MVAHISDELRCNLSGGELQDTPVYELAVCQEFDIRKDLFLAPFGRSLTMLDKLRGGPLNNRTVEDARCSASGVTFIDTSGEAKPMRVRRRERLNNMWLQGNRIGRSRFLD